MSNIYLNECYHLGLMFVFSSHTNVESCQLVTKWKGLTADLTLDLVVAGFAWLIKFVKFSYELRRGLEECQVIYPM